MSKWIPLEEKTPENGEYVLLSFANEKQKPLVGVWKENETCGVFYAPFTDRTYSSLNYFVNAWMPLPEQYREVGGQVDDLHRQRKETEI